MTCLVAYGKIMPKYWVVAVMLALAVGGCTAAERLAESATPFWSDVAQGGEAWEKLNDEVMRMDEYVETHAFLGIFPYQIMDDAAATAAGISREGMALSREMVRFQRAMSFAALRSPLTRETIFDVDASRYPRVQAFMDGATAYHERRSERAGEEPSAPPSGLSDA